ncbi:CHAT domain-containing protein [Ephemerocybe angulata]|uniref:CHAT domain-containing protein n=1 Tax=Ephemerocybe angulata TaxID=980116 RepID=A0A8H6HW38_9AGAR|nr:CHAT domain-containing protein [Tulosesus angulatus]
MGQKNSSFGTDHAAQLNDYACHQWILFEQTGELSMLTDGISCVRQAIDLTPQGNANLPMRLSNLGGMLMCRFECLGELSDMEDAIAVLRKAVDLTPQGDSELPGFLNNLGGSLIRRFEHTGELTDISDAIAVLQKAVNLTPRRHPGLPGSLNNLGGSLTRRFERTGELSDISEAIAVRQKAVSLIPRGHPDLPRHLDNLGTSFKCRFERTGELKDIADAIAVQQKCVDLTRRGHPDLPGHLNNLGSSFMRRFGRTGELKDVMDAMAVLQNAVDLTPQGHPGLPGLLNNLGHSLTCRFECTRKLTDIADAIAVQEKAVELTPDGHADLPARLYNLGSSFYQQFLSRRNVGDLEEAIYRFKTVAISNVGSLQVRLDGAQRWARRSIEYNPSSPDIIAAFDRTLNLLAIVAGLDYTVKSRYTQLESTSGVALEAAAAACALDRPDKALEWLEQGRCLVWNQLHNLRTPLDDLRTQDPDLAAEIANVSQRLEQAASSRGQSHVDMTLQEKMSLELEARAHSDLAKKWDDLLRRARALPGFESFLKPSPCTTIMSHLPESGPIIVINVHTRRCDALALMPGSDEPFHIPLPNFSIDKAEKYRTVFDTQLRARKLRAREVEVELSVDDEFSQRGIRPAPIGKKGEDLSIPRALRGLWEDVVKPILASVGFPCIDRTSGEVPARIWWCPTGPLSFLPLHAAGIYRGPDAESVFDYVVSSYTPTVTAITDRVKNHRFMGSNATSGLFLTSQPRAPKAPPIPGTTKEVRSIFEQAKESGVRASKLEGDEMSVAACLARMEQFSSIHLACHGSQNAAEPLESRFLFHQGDLELGTILRSNLKHADLAFLSACQTSTGQEKLSDEAVHLAAGMLAAGYRRVIGTMWSIGDAPAQKVATTFYEYLLSHRDETAGSTFDGSLSAIALHHATQELRLSLDDSEHSLLTWIPFIHFGL